MVIGRFSKVAVLVAALLGPAAPAFAQTVKPDGSVPVAELMQTNGVDDFVLGQADAPVTIIEYASLTCPHCANFHINSLPSLKKTFVESGKVRFIFRDFPFDGLALAGAMMARCAGPMKAFAVLDSLFAEQEAWAGSTNPEAALMVLARKHGFTQESFGACLQNQKIYDAVLAGRKRAQEQFDVKSTPTLFINGARYRGALSPEELANAVTAALPPDRK